jgi:outer membrane lipoprotein-sorting protein
MRTGLFIGALALSIPAARSAPNPNAQIMTKIKASMHNLGGRFKDMDTLANLVFSPPKSSGDAARKQRITMTAHLYVRMPDKVKFQVLNSDFPLFNRWIFLQNGNDFSAYDPVSDRRIATDFKKLTGRDPARVDTSMAMLGLLFDPARYNFQYLGKSTLKGKPVYRVRLKLLKPVKSSPISLLSHTDLYVDTQRFTPIYSASYDVSGNLANTADFKDVRQTPLGYAPLRITITDHEFARLRKKGLTERARKKIARKVGAPSDNIAPEVFGHQSAKNPDAFRNGTLDLWLDWNNGVLYPKKMLATTPVGATSQWTFSNTKVNTGLPDKTFRLK